MAGWHYLSDEEVKLIQWSIDEARLRRRDIPPPAGVDDSDDYRSADCYIALTPTSGIPNLIQAGTGTSGASGAGDQPGSALCQIYRVINGNLTLLAGGLSKTVYNLSSALISGSSWVVVVKDKFGEQDKWIAIPTAVGGFVGVAQQHLTLGGFGNVLAGGITYNVYAPFGDVVHGALVWIEWDSINRRWTAVQTSCPVGSGT